MKSQVCVFVSVEWLTHATELTVEQVWASPSEPVGPDVWLCRAPTVGCNCLHLLWFCKLRHGDFDGLALMVGCRCWLQNFLLFMKGVDRCEMRTRKDTHPNQHTSNVPWWDAYMEVLEKYCISLRKYVLRMHCACLNWLQPNSENDYWHH